MNNANDTGTKQAHKLLGTGRPGFGNGTDPGVGKDTRFKSGQSGNPAGKPKGTKNLSTMIQEMLNDEGFINKLSAKIKDEAKLPDPEFQGTPMKAIISTAMVEAMSTGGHPSARSAARDWIARYGYGTKVDVTSKGERLVQAPIVISQIAARPADGIDSEATVPME